MAYKPKIVLQAPLKEEALLPAFVETCLGDGVELIAVVGEGCEAIHDHIDDLIVGDGSDGNRFIITTWHPDELLEEVLEFADIFGNNIADGVELVGF